MCVSTILNYVDVQQCLFSFFQKGTTWESLAACVGEGVHMYGMHVLNYFIHIQSAFVSFFYAYDAPFSGHINKQEQVNPPPPAAEVRVILLERRCVRQYQTKYLTKFDNSWPRFLFLLVLLHFGLQALVVLQSLLPAFHRHVEAREDATVPETTPTDRHMKQCS